MYMIGLLHRNITGAIMHAQAAPPFFCPQHLQGRQSAEPQDAANRLAPALLGVEAIFGGLKVLTVACGNFHTLVVTMNGAVWTFRNGEAHSATAMISIEWCWRASRLGISTTPSSCLLLVGPRNVHRWRTEAASTPGARHQVSGTLARRRKCCPRTLPRSCCRSHVSGATTMCCRLTPRARILGFVAVQRQRWRRRQQPWQQETATRGGRSGGTGVRSSILSGSIMKARGSTWRSSCSDASPMSSSPTKEASSTPVSHSTPSTIGTHPLSFIPSPLLRFLHLFLLSLPSLLSFRVILASYYRCLRFSRLFTLFVFMFVKSPSLLCHVFS